MKAFVLLLLLSCTKAKNYQAHGARAADPRDADYEYPDDEDASGWNKEHGASDDVEEPSPGKVYALDETVQDEGERASRRADAPDAGVNWQKAVRISSCAVMSCFVFFIVCVYSGYLSLISRSIVKAVVVRYRRCGYVALP